MFHHICPGFRRRLTRGMYHVFASHPTPIYTSDQTSDCGNELDKTCLSKTPGFPLRTFHFTYFVSKASCPMDFHEGPSGIGDVMPLSSMVYISHSDAFNKTFTPVGDLYNRGFDIQSQQIAAPVVVVFHHSCARVSSRDHSALLVPFHHHVCSSPSPNLCHPGQDALLRTRFGNNFRGCVSHSLPRTAL